MNVESFDTVEVVTAGHPELAVAEAFERCGLQAGVHHVSVEHDDGCPCLTRGRPIGACRCEIVRLVYRRRVR